VNFLVSLEQFQARHQLGNSETLVNTIKLVLSAATVHLSEYLRTGFDRQTQTDFYYVADRIIPARDGMYTLLLSNGFVFVDESTDPAPAPFSVYVGNTLADMHPKRLSKDAYILNSDSGKLTILSLTDEDGGSINLDYVDGYYIRVEYTHGFEVKSTVSGKVYTGVPDWLQEAATLIAYELFCLNDTDKEQKQGAFKIPPSVYALLGRNLRISPSSYSPLR
jgi:hypothetical protein